MTRDAIISKLRAIRSRLADEGVVHLAMFGSRARGDNRSDSDIDLLIEVSQPRTFSMLNLVGVEQIVTEEIGVPTNAIMRRSLDPAFDTSIRDDVVEVF